MTIEKMYLYILYKISIYKYTNKMYTIVYNVHCTYL